MRWIARLPLGWVRALGTLVGWVLYVLAVPRRRVVMRNLALCFPQHPLAQRRRWALECFVYFAQAWFDRSWLWNGPVDVLRGRLRIVGAVQELQGQEPTVIFAPHFFGLDAAGTAINHQIGRPMVSIYTPQRSEAVDQWLHDGRRRFGNLQLFYRDQGVKALIAALREGALLYLLSDMNFGPEESIFVPFYGVPAATVPSLPRFARLGRAKVVPVTARITPQGYDIEVHPAWRDYPGSDVEADTAYMNRWLEGVINTMPSQYYWVHKRFKTRPAGEPPVY
ncbi:lysophospholipid acyltransferase family protein [Rhodoferax sp. BAB1]|uniref:lysophospholipid acyltransferase family protein n=1 Tax=Rhodoferax sp. BAB1 TaxID=2741720 RepID=UPI001576A785|nr:lipid A biosynthesis acyltransferase [Rhodoferax sp. BAB1]QKO22857.1 lipid A biosynthesis acyltransferase [Rhodoferax sp. BAB1]